MILNPQNNQLHTRYLRDHYSYSLHCKVFQSIEQSWQFIEQLHEQQISYNLIYLPGIIYCLPRKHQGTYADASWSSGFAWYEVSGGFTTFNHTQFMDLDCEALEQELSLLKLQVEKQSLKLDIEQV